MRTDYNLCLDNLSWMYASKLLEASIITRIMHYGGMHAAMKVSYSIDTAKDTYISASHWNAVAKV